MADERTRYSDAELEDFRQLILKKLENARADYELYLTAHPEAAFRRAIDDRDEAALRLLVGLSLPTADAAVYCARVGWSAGAAVLLGRAKRAKKTYDFDDL